MECDGSIAKGVIWSETQGSSPQSGRGNITALLAARRLPWQQTCRATEGYERTVACLMTRDCKRREWYWFLGEFVLNHDFKNLYAHQGFQPHEFEQTHRLCCYVFTSLPFLRVCFSCKMARYRPAWLLTEIIFVVKIYPGVILDNV